jgi:hypothetical protein
MTKDRRPDPAEGSQRVSQNAPGFVSPSAQAWADALSDPSTKRALDEGLADFAAGRVRPWESRRRAR